MLKRKLLIEKTEPVLLFNNYNSSSGNIYDEYLNYNLEPYIYIKYKINVSNDKIVGKAVLNKTKKGLYVKKIIWYQNSKFYKAVEYLLRSEYRLQVVGYGFTKKYGKYKIVKEYWMEGLGFININK